MRSMALRCRERTGEKQGFQRRLRLGGMLGAAPPVAVVALVAMDDAGLGKQAEQGLGGDAVGHLAAGQNEGERPTGGIGQRVDFGRAPAA